MATQTSSPYTAVSGHVRIDEGKRRKTWVAKWRDGAGQHEKRLGPAWTGRGRAPEGFLREREAQAMLEAILTDARRGVVRQQRTGLTFAELAEEWHARGQVERDWSINTRRDYRSVLDAHLLEAFGALPIEAVTARRIETWRNDFVDSGQSRRNTNKIHAVVHAILQRGVERHGLQRNAAAQVKKLRESYDAARFDFYSPAEVAKLAVHAADETDAAMYRTAAFSGLRMGELIALLWEDVDFDNHSLRVWEGYKRGEVGAPKSRKSRTVPMVNDVARVLRALKQRDHATGPKDLVFPSEEGGHQDPSALRRRYKKARTAAKLRPLRFHDLRHTFGSLAINTATIVQVQAWMGHADIKTTMRYLHHKSRADDARLLSAAFRPDEAGDLNEAA